ncbi:ApeA N-terminal domain 1-containing protein [Sphingobacterium pedocola]|uniref:ApeA N-terminal domain-containing protein n=1 Tax=Sphingobacterium pedocola TaxID=2082722 RepID=A0ABR9TBI2_9SPHI|nr:HEPN domain-containing protein [Sphingobacterium pedocola]MBE8722703.1 hypothetical protein [Sphingobacterium pedocola]
MLNKEKYHGEIWFPEREEERCFCVLFYKDGQVFLETNLGTPERAHVNKYEKILGSFTGLGCLTFIDCELNLISSGAIISYIYESRYTFIHPEEFFSPELTTKSYRVSYNGLLDWRRWNPCFVAKEQIINYGREESHVFEIAHKNLSVEMLFFSRLNFDKNMTIAQNYSKLRLNYDIDVPLGRAIDDYEIFQKLIQFLTGSAPRFNSFGYLCPISNEWGTVYFEDNGYKELKTGYFLIEFRDIVEHLPALVNLLYTDEKFLFCIERLLDNHIDGRLSHSKRFTNSISTFEAFCKNYTERSNTKLNGFFEEHKDLICEIMNFEEDQFKIFKSKIARSRNYHVHANINDHGSNDIFSDFELLYLSFALDSIVAIGLLKHANVSTKVIDKFIYLGKMTYGGMQSLNRELRQDSIRDWSAN